MTVSDVNKSCNYSRHSGPVGCLPAPNIFPLAKETFAKEKMFWNLEFTIHDMCETQLNSILMSQNCRRKGQR